MGRHEARSDGVVTLRHPRAADEREYLTLRREARSFLEPWEPFAPGRDGRPDPSVDCFGEDWFDRYLATCCNERTRRFLITLATPPATILGQVSLAEIILGPLQQCFLGYWISPVHARRGYATRGVRLALGIAFGELGLHRVEANIQPQNAPSIALARRVGMRREGHSPGYLQIQGRWADHERWAILREEFEASR